MLDRPGGVQQVLIHLAAGLRERGHTVKIITPRPAGYEGEAPEDYILLGTSSRFNPSLGTGTAGTWTMDIDSKDVRALLNKEQFDVINFHEPWTPMLARQILPYSHAAHVGTFHANLADSLATKSIINVFMPYGRAIAQKLHILTVVSPASAAVLVNKANGTHVENKLLKNIKFIPNAIDLKVYKPFKKRTPLNGEGTKTVLYVGRLEKRKGVEWLIKAFGELTKEMPHAYLLIGGEGKQRRQLEQLVKTEEIPNVNFLGYISDEQKRHLMGNADLFCSPAMNGESFGIVLLEAMAMGAPVLAGNNIGYQSVLKGHGRVGLVDARATGDFANRLFVGLNDVNIQNLLRGWGLHEVKQYDYPKIIDQYEAAYRDAIRLLEDSKSGHKEHAKDEPKTKRVVRRLFVRRHA
jgi:phosphatidylinositol alpha-mannosyltransferase